MGVWNIDLVPTQLYLNELVTTCDHIIMFTCAQYISYDCIGVRLFVHGALVLYSVDPGGFPKGSVETPF